MALAEPQRAVAMIAELVAGIGVHEHVELVMIQREPSDDVGELRRLNAIW